MLAVADLLGVPESDHETFREGFGLRKSPGQVGAEDAPQRDQRARIASTSGSLPTSKPAGASRAPTCSPISRWPSIPTESTPDVTAVVRIATFLFAAGQETTARLLASALKYLVEYPELQDELREHTDRIPNFIEETLRMESPVKADFRLARRAATVGDVARRARAHR